MNAQIEQVERVYVLSSDVYSNIEKAWWECNLNPHMELASWLFPNKTTEIEVSVFGDSAPETLHHIAKLYNCSIVKIM